MKLTNLKATRQGEQGSGPVRSGRGIGIAIGIEFDCTFVAVYYNILLLSRLSRFTHYYVITYAKRQFAAI